MPKLEIDFPDDFLGDLLDSEFQDIAERALKESAPLLKSEVQNACQSVIKDKSRNDLVSSIAEWKSGVKKAKTGAYMLGVSFTGKPSEKSTWTSTRSNGKTRKRNTTNNDIAWWLEHGNAHQPAKPFIDRASRNASERVVQECQKIFNEMVGIK